MNRKHNQHYQDTHAHLIRTVLSIVDSYEGGYVPVTVKQVCDRADVNRTTFYAHFTDMADLFEQTDAMLSAKLREHYPEELARFSFVPFLTHVKTYRTFYRAAVRYGVFAQPKADMHRLARRFLLPLYERQNGAVPPEDTECYCSSFCFSVYAIVRLWLEENCRRSVEEIEQIIQACLPIDFAVT